MGLLVFGCAEVILRGLDSNSLNIESKLTTVQSRSDDGEIPEEGLSSVIDHALSFVEFTLEYKHFGEEGRIGHSFSL